uniref:Lysosomal associated membrane protein 2 n=1 Tax=Leptobrachium leishanense TaxID=445787 RepID=A0A8C5PVF2_9ANUR
MVWVWFVQGFMQSEAFEVEIKNSSDHTCIHASLMVNFTVTYEITNSSKNASFSAPDTVTTNGSSCGNDSSPPLLWVNFGNGHSWSLNFTKTNITYRGDVLTFTYNLSDTTYFKDALKGGLVSSTTKFLDPVPLNSTFRCVSDETLISENVTQLIWNVTLQAFIQDDTFGQEFVCDADKPATTTQVTPNVTTPTPTPKPVDKPSIGNYSASNSTGKCLLASMGLQVNVSLTVEGKNVSILFNINPDTTNSSGRCGNETATLSINDTKIRMDFDFEMKKNNFHLDKLAITLDTDSGRLYRIIQNLTLWEASLESSYLCRKEQTISVSEDLQVNTFDVRVQPFGVHNETYGTAEECFADANLNFLIPIAVGVVLLLLIVLVLISYLIGRRKSRTGYQSV